VTLVSSEDTDVVQEAHLLHLHSKYLEPDSPTSETYILPRLFAKLSSVFASLDIVVHCRSSSMQTGHMKLNSVQ